MIDDSHINKLTKNQVSLARYSKKCVTQIYSALYENAMFVPLKSCTNMATVK